MLWLIALMLFQVIKHFIDIDIIIEGIILLILIVMNGINTVMLIKYCRNKQK